MKPFMTTAEFLTHILQVRIYLHFADVRYHAQRRTLSRIRDRVERRRRLARLMRDRIEYHALQAYLDDLLRAMLN